MSRRGGRPRRRWEEGYGVAALLSIVLAAGCGESTSPGTPPPRETGAARLTVLTRGLEPDSDGYGVQVDARSAGVIPSNWVMIVDSLTPGSHTLALDGLSSNCAVNGANPRSVDIVAGETAEVRVVVNCTTTFATVSAGVGHTCGLTPAGSAYCWGFYNSRVRPSPVAVLGGLDFRAVSAGGYGFAEFGFTCAVTSTGAGYCWGDNQYGQLGDGSVGFGRESPVAVVGGLRFTAMSAGGSHTCGVTTAGGAYCWGDNSAGQLGDSSFVNQASPVAVMDGFTFAEVSAGTSFTCGVTTGGKAYCWGENYTAQLGDGTTSDRTSPVPVAGGLSFATVSAGALHACGVTVEGAAYCWGANVSGRLGIGSENGPEDCGGGALQPDSGRGRGWPHLQRDPRGLRA